MLASALTMTTGLLLSTAATAAPTPGAPTADRSATPRLFHGYGFDICQAPDLATMKAWRDDSPYGAAGIYFGGRARACKTQQNLTTDWVAQTSADGWALIPIYVGSQSPCVSGAKNPYHIDPDRAWEQGTSEASDAVNAAKALGLAAGSALYLDMEAYDASKPACADPTLAYVRGWDRGLHAAGYLAGFYSSADSGIKHMERARADGTTDLPDALWYARWGVTPNVAHDPSLNDGSWTPHARIHQYSGARSETHGGRKMSVDPDLVDAPVAVVQ